ncbi:MAG: hypothetical protein WKF43_09210 [Acidimicrobiales bacterium]
MAQRTWHLAGDEVAPEPLVMAAEVVRAAAADSGASGDVLAAVDSLQAVYCMTWPYDDLPGRLAEHLGIDPRQRRYSGIGGTVPQQLVAAAAVGIEAGELDVAVVCGAEALDTVRRLKKAGERPAWSHRHPDRQPMPFEAPFHPAEVAHEVFQAWLTFALRDVARRAHRGAAPDAYRDQLGLLLAPLTEVAAGNPHAWFPRARSGAELITPTADNRMVGYPYTKSMVAIMDVDMAAAVVVASQAAADRLGVPADRRVHLRGRDQATDAIYVAEHPDLWRSPAMATAFSGALTGAGVGVEDVAHLDLYSCFASSLLFATDALGLDPSSDDRSLTVTGGLPYAGGPASNYLTHAVATMVERLRADPGSIGLVSGVGMHMTKHVAAVYSTEPGPMPAAPPSPASSEPARVPIVDTYDGPATIATYSVVHGRDGEPQWGLMVADVEDGRARTYARVEDDALLAAMEEDELVGATVSVVSGTDAVNRVAG